MLLFSLFILVHRDLLFSSLIFLSSLLSILAHENLFAEFSLHGDVNLDQLPEECDGVAVPEPVSEAGGLAPRIRVVLGLQEGAEVVAEAAGRGKKGGSRRVEIWGALYSRGHGECDRKRK